MSEAEALSSRYDPAEVEGKWYAWWEKQLYFAPRLTANATYTIMIPPPNVTGSLHMGHACRTAFEDVLTRHARMSGKATLWLPGTDHAGIATQLVVSRQLEAEGTSREAIGRNAFEARVWEWKAQSGDRILTQLRELGASCDWSRQRFTLDADYAAAVEEAFLRLYREGLIYRGERLVNWSISTQTAVSDLEVENHEEQGEIWDFAYPLATGSGEIVVSTTRPETVFGDSAVAVHPDDPRYQALIGTQLRHPLLDREIPVIADAILVDPTFGSGAVKVTPAHDPRDFETGKRHNLPMLTVIDRQGMLTEAAGRFAGLERFAARKAVVAALDAAGLLRGAKPHKLSVPRAQRGGEVIEPLLSTQWFVCMQPLAEPAIAAVRSGEVKIFPEDWSKTYFHWLENIQDWCISRQLWWGHRIPAWYCESCGEVHVASEAPRACSACGHDIFRADEDVLDTWFSSSLWPFATLGWPKETETLKRFYPGDDLETGYDILFFWVARMIMMGLHFTGTPPFKRVLLSGLVTDERGEKMSKVKGNVIDPLDVARGATLEDLVAKAQAAGASAAGLRYLKETYPEGFVAYGADALRMTLLSYSPQTRRIALSLKRIEGYRNFSNKLWNATRLVLSSLPQDARVPKTAPLADVSTLPCVWILARLDETTRNVGRFIEGYRLDEAAQAIYHFLWDEYCDWFLELMKGPLRRSPAEAHTYGACALYVLDQSLRLLHPMMPFITEELWQRLPGAKDAAGEETLLYAAFPRGDDRAEARQHDRFATAAMSVMQEIVGGIRTVRTQHQLPRHQVLEAELFWREPSAARSAPSAIDAAAFESSELLNALRASVRDLTNTTLRPQPVGTGSDLPPRKLGPRDALLALTHCDVHVLDVVDLAAEKLRLGRELEKAMKDLALAQKKLSNAAFVDKAPAEVVATEREREASLERTTTLLKQRLGSLG